ncbi:DUF3644 domain-containing protein [Schleiferia thermophila]|jgi:hypothetical protein|uniref:DUF3644 domain-containing protein n=1 Tax=Schleiferia thermophila TaxID=884107 RepID=A0A369A858_9FLAO|nr:DUF3644 domain-containing protein [Schleiferia thermophila]RCX05499.1 hypothetical protein DES35_101786 [Schleiferia thermophila]GCD79005.1 hypothetical protein JCM30197_02520 [Schleiferia thermophila]
MRKEAKHLYQKAIDSLTLSIELFNRPNDCGRAHGVLIFMDHSFEMLLKASIIHKGGKIKDKRAKQTIGFSACVRKAFSDNDIKFLSDTDVLTLQIINGLRNAAQHYILYMTEQYLYFQAQAGLTLFRDIVKKVFNIDLKTHLPERVLPLSTTPPMDIQAFFSSEVQEIKKLLTPKSRKKLEATEKLRALAIMENAIQGNESQPSDKELKALAKQLLKTTNLEQLFPSVSTLSFTQNGYGPSLDLRITKSEGVPVTLVPEGTPGAGVVAIKRVNELEFYSLGRDQLAKNLGLTGPKTTAAIKYFRIKEDPECYKQIKIGKVLFDRYSQKAIEKIKEGLKTKTIEEIWNER